MIRYDLADHPRFRDRYDFSEPNALRCNISVSALAGAILLRQFELENWALYGKTVFCV
jgi:hypothetical protein